MKLTLAEVRQRQTHPHLDADPTYATLVMRRVSPYLTWFIVRHTRLSADAVTLGAILSGVVAGGLLLLPHPASYLGAALFLQVAYLCDTSDGEVARLRGTAGRRGAYLDLIGHHIQDRALWLAAAYELILLSAMAPGVVAIVMFSLAFAHPFAIQARSQAMRSVDPDDPVHGKRRPVVAPARATPLSLAYYAYRRVAFLWNYPAAMNLFCVAILADAVRFAVVPGTAPLALPLLYLVFGPTRALRQFGNAVRLFRAPDWG
jgi:phosphatidylglycerophosphate synthase